MGKEWLLKKDKDIFAHETHEKTRKKERPRHARHVAMGSSLERDKEEEKTRRSKDTKKEVYPPSALIAMAMNALRGGDGGMSLLLKEQGNGG